MAIKKKMLSKRNIKFGKNKISFIFLILIFFQPTFTELNSKDNLEGEYTIIKILDKISSKNDTIKLKNKEEVFFKDLSVKSLKCSNSEFDDNPEIKAYIQVKDVKNENKDNANYETVYEWYENFPDEHTIIISDSNKELHKWL